MSKPIHIDWIAKNALDGTMQLGPWEELAYRRIMDMIYASDDQLMNDDESLRWSTKTGTKWPKVKQRLLALKKIEITDDGRITNAVCREKLSEAHHRIGAARNAGHASAEARKSPRNNKSGSTDVTATVPTEDPTDRQPTTNYQLPSSESKDSSDAREFEEFWKLFPKQRAGSRTKAYAAYRHAKQRARHDEIMRGLRAYVASDEVARGFAKGAAAWLNDDRWTSNYEIAAGGIAGLGGDEITRTIGRAEYDRCQRLIKDASNKKGLQAVIDAYHKQNPAEQLQLESQMH